MRHRSKRLNHLAAVLFLTVLLSACGGRNLKGDFVQAADIPKSFDVTIIAEKDTTFDYEGAPLTAEDLRSALRYRKEESLPVATILMKRGEKERIKNEHIVSLARVAYQLKMRAFMQAKDGTISELVAQAKTDDATSKTPPPPPPQGHDVPPGGH
jgi:hypothetical protein